MHLLGDLRRIRDIHSGVCYMPALAAESSNCGITVDSERSILVILLECTVRFPVASERFGMNGTYVTFSRAVGGHFVLGVSKSSS